MTPSVRLSSESRYSLVHSRHTDPSRPSFGTEPRRFAAPTKVGEVSRDDWTSRTLGRTVQETRLFHLFGSGSLYRRREVLFILPDPNFLGLGVKETIRSPKCLYSFFTRIPSPSLPSIEICDRLKLTPGTLDPLKLLFLSFYVSLGLGLGLGNAVFVFCY